MYTYEDERAITSRPPLSWYAENGVTIRKEQMYVKIWTATFLKHRVVLAQLGVLKMCQKNKNCAFPK